MKNPIKLCWNWILRLFRRKQFKKRQEVYDEVIDKLSEAVEKINEEKIEAYKLKQKAQSDLREEMLTYMRVKLGYDSQSEYIPKHGMNDIELKSKLNIKFKFRMDKLGMRLTDDMKVVCI